MKVQVVLTGRSHPTSEVPESFELADGATVDDALAKLSEALSDDVSLPATCLIAVSGTHLGTLNSHEARELCDGDELVIIAPVAGG